MLKLDPESHRNETPNANSQIGEDVIHAGSVGEASAEQSSADKGGRKRGEPVSDVAANKKRGKEPKPHESKLYDNLVPAYQALWPAVARRRILRNVAALNIPAQAKVLEVGVGTGLSLDSYPHHANVTGVDLSESMLAEAEDLIEQREWNHISVQPMNAEELTFEDASFDFVTSFHTISVVSRPDRMMRELVRVCRPGGKILVINHFRSPNPLIARVVDSAGSLTRHLGWRTDLNMDDLLNELPIQVTRCHKSNPLSLFRVLLAERKA
ncbi:class I SAM-dependent methyltransferase [Rhodopirellula halodulae]|uniref:class I SAM-dependent methyltransferase n=1 Tax=Rhodopirellula halodulae TaxID=2894198 RepID=UPI001E55B3A8|nr:class I SAM-dependent methyltransferase [Rhodopirellula sp. JC737]MCC9656424.1 class I SAM-dependent methyltransferase [Rhodopirellula sp. JC737]